MSIPGYLEDWILPGQRPSVVALRDVLERLGHPERAVPVVLVGGTNGKGSTVAFLDAILQAAGYRVGTFTSPPLFDFHEQIRVDGKPISSDDGSALSEQIRGNASERLTLFETTTAMAFLAFQRHRPDIAVVEVGMGGAHDATNVCDPVVSILTSVGLDHVAELGGSLESIALEKAGIARPGRPLVSGVMGSCRALLEAAVDARPLDVLNRHFQMVQEANELHFRSPDLHLARLHLGIPGPHQHDNAAMAVQAARRLAERGHAISRSAMRRGLRKAHIRGRWEWFEHPGGYRFLVDGGHNPLAASAIARSLEASTPSGPRWMAVAIFEDKDVEGFLAPLLPHVEYLICTRSGAARCLAPERIREAARRVAKTLLPRGSRLPELAVVPTISEAVEVFGHNKGGMNVLCGSFSVVQEAEQAVRSQGAAQPCSNPR